MRIFSLVSLFTLGLFYAGLAQVDVLNARANPKTFIFDDDKHTVHGYIYSQLKEKTSCCGNDAVYLEVKFDASGSVTSAKTLTGKNECFKQSVVDIVSSVRWDATGVQGSKTIYFEVKPIIPCSGSPTENVYKKIPRVGGDIVIASNGGNEGSNEVAVKETPKEPVKPVVEPVEEVVVAPVKETPKEPVKPVVEEVVEVETKTPTKAVEEDGFLSDESGMEESSSSEEPKPAKEPVKPVVKQPTKEVIADVQPTKEKVTINERSSAPAPTPTVSKPRSGGGGSIPPQAKLDYVSNGDVSPDPSHRETHANLQPGRVEDVKISDESQFGVQMRTSLRKAGYCGLANALIEVEVDRYGSVVNSRIMYANSDKVKEILPGIVKGLKFQAPGAGNVKSFYSYYQVKTEIVCDGGKPKYNLDEVPPVIKTPEGQP